MSRPPTTGALWESIEAVLFDLDGVLTPTALVHRSAWKEMFDAYLLHAGATEPFSDDDYFRYVDGRPRYDGVRAFLASRGITLPDGEVSDPPGFETVCALGNRKNAVFGDVLRRDGVRPYPGSLALLEYLGASGIDLGLVSSSANAGSVLEAASLTGRFRVVVDGVRARDVGLAGKPAPDTYLFAAQELGVPVRRTIVIEDAISGVAAASAGGFGTVVGVDREGIGDALAEAGADVVVEDLSELLP